MSLMGILFSPNGRIQAGEFWRGLIILIGAGLVLSILSTFASGAIAGLAGLLGILLIYPYICVFGKRLHDSNKSAWMWLLFLLGYLVLVIIMTTFLVPLYPGAAEATAVANEKMAELLESGEFSFAGMMEITSESARATAAPSLIFTISAQLITGFFAARLFSYPEANKYGPPVGGVVGGSDDSDEMFS